ncbi:MAG: O-antigen ligase C-terminal domain-containing protein, partial [Proteobacteria bacterium]|nr:O-antigen ligase C-terminal domain-containing protein [Pseudomonadota bacterium]
GAIVGILFGLPYVWRNANRKLLAAWLAMCIVGFAVSWIVVPTTGWQASEKEIVSLQGVRAITMPQTIDMILEEPLTGYGYGKFEYSYLHYTAARHAENPEYPAGDHSLSHPHNELLLWTTEGGIIALIALLAAAYFVWRCIYKNEIRTRLALIGLFFPIVLHSQLELPFYQSTAHIIVFILLIYWVDNMTADYQEKQLSSTLLFGVAGIVIPLVTTLYMLTTLQSGLLLARFESGRLAKIEELDKMSNPIVWQDRLNWAIRSRLLVNGITRSEPELAQGYVDWIPELLTREPRPIFYQYLVIANQLLGNTEEVKKVQAEAYYLFPDESFEISDIASRIIRPVTIIGASEVDGG